MADAPQVVYTETSPGAQLINQPYPEPFSVHDHETVYSPITFVEHEVSKDQQSGHKQVSRRTVTIIILILLLVGGAVGGGVGGSIEVKKARYAGSENISSYQSVLTNDSKDPKQPINA